MQPLDNFPEFRYSIHKSSPLAPILSQTNALHSAPLHPISTKSILKLSTPNFLTCELYHRFRNLHKTIFYFNRDLPGKYVDIVKIIHTSVTNFTEKYANIFALSGKV
jgi:hypothetical protein